VKPLHQDLGREFSPRKTKPVGHESSGDFPGSLRFQSTELILLCWWDWCWRKGF